MRFNHHSTGHWIAVAAIAVVALFTFNHARGQGANASAAFEGRPSMSGAQAGQGAQAGVAQGGIGVQGNEAAQRQLNLRKPSGLDSMGAAPTAAPTTAPEPSAVPSVSARSDITLVPNKEEINREVTSPTRTVKRAAKRTVERSRTGVGGIDATGAAVN